MSGEGIRFANVKLYQKTDYCKPILYRLYTIGMLIQTSLKLVWTRRNWNKQIDQKWEYEQIPRFSLMFWMSLYIGTLQNSFLKCDIFLFTS